MHAQPRSASASTYTNPGRRRSAAPRGARGAGGVRRGGRALLRWETLRAPPHARARARSDAAAARGDGEPRDATRRRAARWTAAHLVELRLEREGAHRAGEARLEGRAVPEGARRRGGVRAASRAVTSAGAAPAQGVKSPALVSSP